MVSREPAPMSKATRRLYDALPIPAQIAVRLDRMVGMAQYSERMRDSCRKKAAAYMEGMSDYCRTELLKFRAWEAMQEKPEEKRP